MGLAEVLWQGWEVCVGVGPALMVLSGTGSPEGGGTLSFGLGEEAGRLAGGWGSADTSTRAGTPVLTGGLSLHVPQWRTGS